MTRQNLTMVLLSVVLATLLSACHAESSTNMKPSNGRALIELETTLGKIEIELYNETPKHRDNILKLVEGGYYDGVLFHRVIKDFMIQTGDGNSKTADAETQLGDGDPGYTIDAEIVYPQFFHKRGAVAAARTGDEVNPKRASSGSQFYIVTGKVYDTSQLQLMAQRLESGAKQNYFRQLVMQNRDTILSLQQAGDTLALASLQQRYIEETEAWSAKHPTTWTEQQLQTYSTIGGTPHLDGQYTVFGEVVQGMDVVDKIQQVTTGKMDRPITDVKIIKAKILSK